MRRRSASGNQPATVSNRATSAAGDLSNPGMRHLRRRSVRPRLGLSSPTRSRRHDGPRSRARRIADARRDRAAHRRERRRPERDPVVRGDPRTSPSRPSGPGSTRSGSSTTCSSGSTARRPASTSAGRSCRRSPRRPAGSSSARSSCAPGSATRRCWPRWPPRSTTSAADGSSSASGRAGTTRSSRRSATRPITRCRRFEEALTVITELIRDGRADLAGTYVTARDVVLLPPARPDLPILVASKGPRMHGSDGAPCRRLERGLVRRCPTSGWPVGARTSPRPARGSGAIRPRWRSRSGSRSATRMPSGAQPPDPDDTSPFLTGTPERDRRGPAGARRRPARITSSRSSRRARRRRSSAFAEAVALLPRRSVTGRLEVLDRLDRQPRAVPRRPDPAQLEEPDDARPLARGTARAARASGRPCRAARGRARRRRGSAGGSRRR